MNVDREVRAICNLVDETVDETVDYHPPFELRDAELSMLFRLPLIIMRSALGYRVHSEANETQSLECTSRQTSSICERVSIFLELSFRRCSRERTLQSGEASPPPFAIFHKIIDLEVALWHFVALPLALTRFKNCLLDIFSQSPLRSIAAAGRCRMSVTTIAGLRGCARGISQ